MLSFLSKVDIGQALLSARHMQSSQEPMLPLDNVIEANCQVIQTDGNGVPVGDELNGVDDSTTVARRDLELSRQESRQLARRRLRM